MAVTTGMLLSDEMTDFDTAPGLPDGWGLVGTVTTSRSASTWRPSES